MSRSKKFKRTYPTQDELRRLLYYNRKTGLFVWRVEVRPNRPLRGCSAGTHDGHGHIAIRINGCTFPAHRIAWIYVRGQIPDDLEVDHVDMNGINNKFKNLRLATFTQQQMNRRALSNNKCGLKGVHFVKRSRRWCAQITIQNKRTWIGEFETVELAAQAYFSEAKKHYGEYARAK